MKKIAILYGSSLGNTKYVAEKIATKLPVATLKSVSQLTNEELQNYSFLILGVSTWGIGGMQDEFETFIDTLLSTDLSNKTIALFGCGDQQTYPDTYCNAVGKLFDILQDKGCRIIGECSTEGYDFSQSLAVRNDKFVGLAIDEENQPDLTEYRIKKWLESIAGDLKD